MPKNNSSLIPMISAVVLVGVCVLGYLLWQNQPVSEDVAKTDVQLVNAESQLVIVARNQTAEAGKFGVSVQTSGEEPEFSVTLLNRTDQSVLGSVSFESVGQTRVLGEYNLKLVNNTELSSQVLVTKTK